MAWFFVCMMLTEFCQRNSTEVIKGQVMECFFCKKEMDINSVQQPVGSFQFDDHKPAHIDCGHTLEVYYAVSNGCSQDCIWETKKEADTQSDDMNDDLEPNDEAPFFVEERAMSPREFHELEMHDGF